MGLCSSTVSEPDIPGPSAAPSVRRSFVLKSEAPRAIEDHYYIHRDRKIGEPGYYGAAFICEHVPAKDKLAGKTGELRAVKIINKKRFMTSDFFENFRNEIAILRQMDHPNIIKAFDAFETEDELFIITELCTGHELFDQIATYQKQGRQYTEQEASRLMRQLFEGIHYLHEKKIAHCDIKPDNCLFMSAGNPDSPLKIIDFGLSKHRKHHRVYLKDAQGTPFYMAPEVFLKKYTESCDIWSLGVVLFVLLYGYFPFRGPNGVRGKDDEVERAVRMGFIPETREGNGNWFPAHLPRSQSVKDLLTRMFRMDPAERITAAEALKHPWLKGETAPSEPIGDVVSAIANLSSTARLRRVVADMYVSKLTSQEQQSLKRAFEAADKDRSGELSLPEFKQVLAACQLDSKVDAETLLKSIDTDGNGTISFEELRRAAAQTKLLANEERLWKQFKQLDRDNSGKISKDELKQVLQTCSQEELAEIIKEVDQNGDGEIDYDEFLAIWITREQADEAKKAAEEAKQAPAVATAATAPAAPVQTSQPGATAASTAAVEAGGAAPASADDVELSLA